MKYDHLKIEKKWQDYWDKNKTFRTPDLNELDKSKPKYYALDMLPYPSGEGLHVGHPEGYTATDIVSRYKRMKGFNVLHPMGWDAFGLPAEQYALKTGIHPKIRTEESIVNYTRQLKSLGFSFDWDRQINTSDPEFFKWTQWIFLKLFNSYFDEAEQKAKPISEIKFPSSLNEEGKKNFINSQRLAYLADGPVNWCPELGTVLANDEVAEQVEKGNTIVRKNMRQWKLRITKYADRLLKQMETLSWPDNIKEIQKNWIGRSEGALVNFKIAGWDDKDDPKAAESITVFTTRPDTIFGATYLVIAPEHPLVSKITTSEQQQKVDEYVEQAARKSDLERAELAKDKTGVFTGAHAINPANHKEIPIFISDYVLISYGTGAIMSVPGHDERDMEFAKIFDLEIIPVTIPYSMKDLAFKKLQTNAGELTLSGPGLEHISSDHSHKLSEYYDEIKNGIKCHPIDGYAVNSDFINGLATPEAKEKINSWLEEKNIGKRSISYKLRDWLFSRQRFWGEPFPIIHLDETNYKDLDPDELPLELPVVSSYKVSGTGESPLANVPEWLNVTDKETGNSAKRETNTMPQLAGSSWYFLRYIDPNNDKAFIDKGKENYWMPVDLYIGGSEHAVGHLLYSRFWMNFLYDLELVSHAEPFNMLFNQGMILGEDGTKMSKSRGNVINPDDVIGQFGADSMRLFEMFMGPLEQSKPWNTKGIEGIFRFLNRVWRMIIDDNTGEVKPNIMNEAPEAKINKVLHFTIKKITNDIESMDMKFNTSIAQMMIFTNELYKQEKISKELIDKFLILLSPFAPHFAEELWEMIGNKGLVSEQEWPSFDELLSRSDTNVITFSVNGKMRAKAEMSIDSTEEELEKEALENEHIIKHIAGKEIVKKIVVKGRMVNIVVR